MIIQSQNKKLWILLKGKIDPKLKKNVFFSTKKKASFVRLETYVFSQKFF